jgi:hypothetical protein
MNSLMGFSQIINVWLKPDRVCFFFIRQLKLTAMNSIKLFLNLTAMGAEGWRKRIVIKLRIEQ